MAVFGERARQQRLQQMMMYAEYMRKSPLGVGESALDIELARQTKEKLDLAEEARRARESEARITMAEEEHKRKIQEFGEVQEARKEKGELEKWEAGERSLRAWEAGERGKERVGIEKERLGLEEKRTGAEVELRGAQVAGEEAKTEATKDWTQLQREESMTKMAKGVWAEAIRNYAMGNTQMFTKENTDHIEKAGTLLFGPGFTVPRDEQGRWKPDPKTVALGMPNEKGEYTGEFARNLNEINKPGTPYESWLKAANEAVATGDTFTANMLIERAHKEIRPTMGEAQGEVFDNFIKRKDLAGAKQFVADISTAKVKAKASQVSASKVHDEQVRLVNLYANLGNLLEHYDAIVRPSDKYPKGRIPVGAMHKPFYDVFGKIEKLDADIATFYGNNSILVSRYINEVTGKQSNPDERAKLERAFPNPDFDSVKTYRHRVVDMMRNTQRTIRQNAGYYGALGIQMPDYGPGFEPIKPSESMARWGDGLVPTPDGLVDRKEFVDAEKGSAALGNQLRREGQQIAGPTEFRPKGEGASPFAAMSDEELQAELQRLKGGELGMSVE
jgi:hypothetical protein